MSVNKVFLLGNLGADPVIKVTQDRHPYCFFSLATEDVHRSSAGQLEKRVDWHNVVVFGTTDAINCSKFLRKGASVFVEGMLRSSSYTDSEGRAQRVTRVVCSRILFLGHKHQEGSVDQELEIVFEDNLNSGDPGNSPQPS